VSGAATGEPVAVEAQAVQAGAPRVDGADAALRRLAEADEAWWRGDRGAAKRGWREALAEAGTSTRGRAVEAMARVRLLQVSGTFGPFVHERRLREALGVCLDEEPWCAIARADEQLWMPAFTGADPKRVPGLLAGSPLQAPAAARIAVATGDRTALRAVNPADLDGVGRGVLATDRQRPPDPGTWTLGVGLSGAPGAGVGLSVRYIDPDLAWHAHTLSLSASADSLGGFSVDGSFTSAAGRGAVAGVLAGGVGRGRGYRWVGDTAETYALDVARGSAGVSGRDGRLGWALGGSGRVERLGSWDGAEAPWGAVAGPYGALTVGDGRGWARLSGEAAGGAYTHVGVSVDVRAYPPVAGGTLALRGLGTVVPTSGSPFYRWPSAGGSSLLRGAPAGWLRGPVLVAGQAEYRHPLVGPLEAAAFVDVVRVESVNAEGATAGDVPRWTAGAGVRLVLPPEKTNVTRVDVGVGPGTWGVVVGWGQAF